MLNGNTTTVEFISSVTAVRDAYILLSSECPKQYAKLFEILQYISIELSPESTAWHIGHVVGGEFLDVAQLTCLVLVKFIGVQGVSASSFEVTEEEQSIFRVFVQQLDAVCGVLPPPIVGLTEDSVFDSDEDDVKVPDMGFISDDTTPFAFITQIGAMKELYQELAAVEKYGDDLKYFFVKFVWENIGKKSKWREDSAFSGWNKEATGSYKPVSEILKHLRKVYGNLKQSAVDGKWHPARSSAKLSEVQFICKDVDNFLVESE